MKTFVMECKSCDTRLVEEVSEDCSLELWALRQRSEFGPYRHMLEICGHPKVYAEGEEEKQEINSSSSY